MKNSCKAKKFGSRLNHRGSGKAVGEMGIRSGVHGKSAGEVKMGNMTKPLKTTRYIHAQSTDGNGGK